MTYKYQIGDLLVLPGSNPLYAIIVGTRTVGVTLPANYASDPIDRGRQYHLLPLHGAAPVWRLAIIVERHWRLAVGWTTD